MANDLKRVGLVFTQEGAVDFKKTLQEINLEMNKYVSKGTRIKNNVYHHSLGASSIKKGEEYNKAKKVIQIIQNVNCVWRMSDITVDTTILQEIIYELSICV